MAIMNALSTAVSGIKAQQTSLDVIANNIANVSTTGYKAQTVTFSDLLSQTISSGSAATATTGGTNAVQVGLGVAVASTSTDLTVGTTSTTSNSTDVALTGAGYLIVAGDSEGEYQFTRAGNLTVDDDGNLNVDGNLICGWQSYTLDADGNKVYNTSGTVESINIYSDDYSGNKKVMAAKATTSADVTGVVDSGSDVVASATLQNIGSTSAYTSTDWDSTTSIDVVDEQGNTKAVTINWKKCATENSTTSWYWEASGTDATISPSSGYVAFDSDGKMVTSVTPLTTALDTTATNDASYSATDMTVTTGLTAGNYTVAVAASATSTGTYDITLTDPDGTTYTTTSTDGSATFTTSSGTVTLAAPTSGVTDGTSSTFTVTAGTAVAFDSTPAITVTSTTAGTSGVSVELDFSKITTTSNSSATLSGEADGYESGTLESYTISSDGTIVGSYSNGETQSIAQIALAVFENAAGLEKDGDNLYNATSSSGNYSTVVAGTGGSGTMTSYALELSNVDLAAQFTNMMVSQRAYQANTKVVTTADDMLQSLINMVG